MSPPGPVLGVEDPPSLRSHQGPGANGVNAKWNIWKLIRILSQNWNSYSNGLNSPVCQSWPSTLNVERLTEGFKKVVNIIKPEWRQGIANNTLGLELKSYWMNPFIYCLNLIEVLPSHIVQ